MTLDQIPLFAVLKGKLGYLNNREKLIAQNVANADTPGFRPSDLKPFTIPAALAAPAAAAAGVTTIRTSTAHLSGKASPKTAWKTSTGPDSEVRLDGNQVVLEEQMMKLTEARLDHDAAIGLYQKSIGLLRLSLRKPGA
jgi:flagellar basal-body rod protein FlgB